MPSNTQSASIATHNLISVLHLGSSWEAKAHFNRGAITCKCMSRLKTKGSTWSNVTIKGLGNNPRFFWATRTCNLLCGYTVVSPIINPPSHRKGLLWVITPSLEMRMGGLVLASVSRCERGRAVWWARVGWFVSL